MQIFKKLTAVLGEPVEVPVSTRERMYALVSQAPVVEDRQNTEAVKAGSAGPAQHVATTTLPERPPMTPDYLKPSTGRNLVLGLLATCLAVGWLGWVLKDQGLLPTSGEQSVAVAELPAEEDTDAPASVLPAEANPPAVSKEPDRSAALATDDNSESVVSIPAEAGEISPLPVPPMPEPAVPNVAAPNQVGLAPQPAMPEPPAAPVVAQKSFPAIFYSNAEGVLLSRDRQSGQWNVMPRRALVLEGDEIATPDPFQSKFTVNGGALEVTLYGGTRVRLEPGVGANLLVIHIDRGRVALRRPAAGEHPEPVSIGLSLRGQLAELTLDEPGTLCGVEVGQRAPQGRRPDPLLLIPDGGVNVVTGSVSMAWNGGPAVTIGSEIGWAGWPMPQSLLVVGPQRAIPNWLAPEGITLTAADKKWNQMFEKEFAVDQPVSLSIPALVLDRREQVSSLATYTLGLVDDIPMLVKALQSDYEPTREAAIWSLRGWLPSNPNHTALLEMEVARIFPDEDVEDVVDLLWGYSIADAKDPMTSRKLVAHMDHKDIAIRELAFFHVSRLTGRHNAHGYRPNLADAPRNATLMGWRNHLEKNGGVLVK